MTKNLAWKCFKQNEDLLDINQDILHKFYSHLKSYKNLKKIIYKILIRHNLEVQIINLNIDLNNQQ